ncbi:MAG: molybdenum cofactor guanylyltransferase [Desulforhopalus sp.]
MKREMLEYQNSMSSLPQLPLFQLTGETATFRRKFLRNLVAALKDHSLACYCLDKGEICSRFAILSYVKRYDVVFAVTEAEMPLETILISCGEEHEGEGLCWSGGDKPISVEFIGKVIAKLDSLMLRTPVWGCLLIGGRSSRMGRPKHLLQTSSGTSWVNHVVKVLAPLLDGMVISGHGLLPDDLQSVIRLPDIPGVAGPLSGIVAAERWQPMVDWLLVACDMPFVTRESVQWMLSLRHCGCWGIVPRQPEARHVEPLFAWYGFRAAQLFEEQLLSGNLRIGAVARHPKIDNPVIPDRLRNAWQNVNTPEQLKSLHL